MFCKAVLKKSASTVVPLQPFGETPMNMHTAWGRVKMSTTSNILKCPEQCTSRVCLTWQYHKWLWGTFRFCPKPKNHKVAFSQHAGGIQPCLPHPKTDAQKAKKWKLRENKIISKFGGGGEKPHWHQLYEDDKWNAVFNSYFLERMQNGTDRI